MGRLQNASTQRTLKVIDYQSNQLCQILKTIKWKVRVLHTKKPFNSL